MVANDMFVAVLGTLYFLASAADNDTSAVNKAQGCNLLVVEMLRDAAVAAAQADACNDYSLKVQQVRLAVNISVAIGIDEGEAGQAFYKFYSDATGTRSGCNMDRMISVSEAFNERAQTVMDYCAIMAP